MADTTHDDVLRDVLELAAIYRPAWAQISDGITGPRCEGEDTPQDDTADVDTTDTEADASTSDDDGEPDWKQHSRKHEREAKKARAEAEELRKKLAAREAADMTEHEKAIADAKE